MKNTILKWGFLIFGFWVSLHAAQAQHTASNITNRYFDTERDCGNSNRPAFLCTGVIIRGTEYSPNYHSWDPSPTSVADGGVSFSFLRKDSKFNKLAMEYKNGIIFYAPFKAPKDKLELTYLCAFPMDGDTNQRSNNGCGPKTGGGYPNSAPCQSLNILSGAAWAQKLTSGAFTLRDKGYYSCGFSVVNNPVNGSANGFMAVIDAMNAVRSASFLDQNEIRAQTWNQGLGKTLPIEAFFYLNGGLASAQADQRDLYYTDGVRVPIIKVTLPTDMSADAKFHYYDDDQAIPPK